MVVGFWFVGLVSDFGYGCVWLLALLVAYGLVVCVGWFACLVGCWFCFGVVAL